MGAVIQRLKTAVVVVVLVGIGMGIGMGLEHARAQSRVTLADAKFQHIGISVKNVDTVVEQYASQLQAPYNPVHEIKGPFDYPKGSTFDPNAFVRTSEITLAGMEIHLMQAMGGPSPWRHHFEKHGEGAIEHIAFASKDVKGVAAALVAKGGRILVGDPAKGFCYIQMPSLPFIIEMYTDRS